MICAYAREEHHIRHLQSVISCLDPGYFSGWVDGPNEADTLTLIASSRDAKLFRGKWVIYVEHGAGQTYNGDPRGVKIGGYSGSRDLDNVAMFLCPNVDVADRWKATYPQVPAPVVGSPYVADMRVATEGGSRDCIVISHHWNCYVCPESMSAAPYFIPLYGRLVAEARDRGITVLGHGHPRSIDDLAVTWKSLGIEVVRDWWEAAARARLLLCDNSSIMYEAAALDIPVLTLNSPEYRVTTHHGLRFWDVVPGFQCWPDEFYPWVAGALEDPDHARWLRARAARYAYASTYDAARKLTRTAVQKLVDSRAEHPSNRAARPSSSDPLATLPDDAGEP